MDCDIKADDLKRMRKDITKAASKNDEIEVRNLAKSFISLQRQHKSAQARLAKVTTRTSTMRDLRVGGLVEKDMLEFVQCHNSLIAPVANPRAVQATMGQFTMQQNAMSICQEMMDDALAEDSEEDEELEEENKAVEALVGEAMSLSSLSILEKLPTINNNNANANQPALTNPDATALRIQEFLQKK